ncbi:MAG: hypothetical protein MUF51_00115 [Vicinamibacteria bacterium]|jgi:hypothetical protein|nr:hypothetical protein [Vicinamibacteria bacterium]
MSSSLPTHQRVASIVFWIASIVLLAAPLCAWGPATHRVVTSKAIDILPKDLRAFYSRHRLELATLAPSTTKADDHRERRFAIDSLLRFPFIGLERSEAAFLAHYAERGRAIGRLPWQIQEAHAELVRAFQSQDKNDILAASDTLASLLTDLHNPLALTENYDGQLSGQNGLWARFSVKLAENAAPRIGLDADAAHFIEQPNEQVLAMLRANYVWIDNLLYEEELARRNRTDYTSLYFEELEARTHKLLAERLSQAARQVGSYWYTAWTAAGRPVLR